MNKIVSILLLSLLIISCGSNDNEVARLVKDKIATMSGHEVIRDLLIENDGDKEQLARIFKCSVFTINRIKDKETYLTDNALSEFKNFLYAVKVSGKDTFKENDPYYNSWIRSFRYWLNSWIIIAVIVWIGMIILGAVLGSQDNEEGAGVLGSVVSLPLIIIFGGGYLITWILNMFWSYEPSINLYSKKLNPIFETLL